MNRIKINNKGFSLTEILVTIAIIGVIGTVAIVAINPVKLMKENRNSRRQADLTLIMNAIYSYSSDNNGQLPAAITTTNTQICKTGGSCAGLIDLSVLTTNQKYLVTMPTDPTGASTNGTGYQVLKTANNRITLTAPNAELSVSITITK